MDEIGSAAANLVLCRLGAEAVTSLWWFSSRGRLLGRSGASVRLFFELPASTGWTPLRLCFL